MGNNSLEFKHVWKCPKSELWHWAEELASEEDPDRQLDKIMKGTANVKMCEFTRK